MICPNCKESNIRTTGHIDTGWLEEWVFCPDCEWKGVISNTEETDGIYNWSDCSTSLGNLRDNRHVEKAMNIDGLKYCAIELTARRMPWDNITNWRFVESVHCDECNTISRESEPCPKCGDTVYAHGPQMSWFYPLPSNYEPDEDSSDLIVHLPLCLVCLGDNEWGLALTGCGMNLTREIAETYIRLGYYPPIGIVSLPEMTGGRKYKYAKPIMDACIKTCEAVEMRAAMAKKRIHQMYDGYFYPEVK